MSTGLLEDHRILIDAVREFAQRELVARDAEWDRSETSCCTELGALAEMGLLGLRAPESAGGLDCPTLPYAQIIRELAAGSASVAVTVAVHSMVSEIIRRFASKQVQKELLPVLAAGTALSAFAISEPNAGSDPGAARVRAEATDQGWRLHGQKMWVTNGLTGRWFVVLARHSEAPPGDKSALSMFLLDAQQPGVSCTPIHGKLGIRGSETAEMNLDGALVPRDHLLGQPGWGLRIALTALDGGRIGIASQAAGIAAAALEQMTRYARTREQFGQPIAEFQAIQWMIADSFVELRAAQALIDRAAWLKDHGRPYTQEASMAKLYASEAANRIVARAVQAHGGSGFVREFRVERLYRDARITTIYEGTSEIQRVVISRNLL